MMARLVAMPVFSDPALDVLGNLGLDRFLVVEQCVQLLNELLPAPISAIMAGTSWGL